MNQIEQTITTVEIAEMMETRHSDVLQKLEGSEKIKGIIPVLTERKIPLSDYFTESTYQDGSGKRNKCYLVTKIGCDFLANKFTGEKGILFTAKYVKRFREMEQIIKNPIVEMTEDEKIELLAKGHVDVVKKIQRVEQNLEDFKQDLPLLGIECQRITRAKNHKVVPLLGGKSAPAYQDKSLRSKVYSDIQREICRQFGVSSYKEIKRCQTEKALEIIEEYQLPFALEQEVQDSNAQYSFA